MPQLAPIIDRFAQRHALVVGDVMLDEYLHGYVERISPEAPVPVVSLRERVVRPGGAANVALNRAALGASVDLVGLRGRDEAGAALVAAITQAALSAESLVASDGRRTTRKARVMSGGQQLLRVDTEDTHPAEEPETAALAEAVAVALDRRVPDVIVLQDYDKGTLTPGLITRVCDLAAARGVPVVVDPKARNFWCYRGVALFKPNLKELAEALTDVAFGQVTLEVLEAGHEALARRLGHERSLVTLGARGAYLRRGTEPGRLLPAHPREVADVCGAGDSVAATAALALAVGADDEALLSLANLAGGLACEHVGVRPVGARALREALPLNG